MRKALIVGIDFYNAISHLSGCVYDARSVESVLTRHADGTLNFPSPQVMTAVDEGTAISKVQLKQAIRQLFEGDSEIALLYFAGHGYVEDTGGFLCASDSETGDDGVSLHEVMTLANKSAATNKVIILDSCHSGAAGTNPIMRNLAELAEGLTILTASTADQVAYEKEGGGAGVFTSLFVDALHGAAANLVGDITPGSIYAHVDQSLGPWAQRPVFRTNVKTFVSLRKALPPIALDDLQALGRLFPSPDFEFPLDPTYEPQRSSDEISDPRIPDPDPVHTADFRILQSCVRVNLVRPVVAPHMWNAAMESRSCELTVLGQHYWNLVNEGLI
ncbi:MAG: caspase family protein [Acidimicrobiales bacterium]